MEGTSTEADFDEAIKHAIEMVPQMKAAIIIGVTESGKTIAFAGGDKELLMAALVYSHIKKGEFMDMFLRIHNTQTDIANKILDIASDKNLIGKVHAIMDLMRIAKNHKP